MAKIKKSQTVLKKKAPVGNTGGEGFRFENAVAARFLLDLLGSTHALGVEEFGKVTRIDWQARDSGWLADDLVITSQVNGEARTAAVSVKSGQRVTTQGFPAEFVAIAWAQWLQLGTLRDFRASNDVAVLATGSGTEAAKKPWSLLTKQILITTPDRMKVRLVDDQEGGQQTSREQRDIFASFKCPASLAATPRDAEERVTLVGKIRWLDFDFERIGSRDFGLAIADCKNVLAAADADRAPQLWERLLNISDDRRGGGSLNLPGLIKELRGEFDFKAHPDFAGDWAELKKRSAAEMEEIKSDIAGLVRIARERDLEPIRAMLTANIGCFLIGDSGCGKSALAKELATTAYGDIIWLGNEALDYASLADFERGGGLRHNLIDIVGTTFSTTLFVFDALEGYSPNAKKIVGQIVRALSATQAHFIFTAQSESAPTILAELLALGISKDVLKTIVVGRPPESEIRTAVARLPKVGWVALNLELRSLLTNLKMLDWFVRFAESGGTINTSNIGLTNLIDSLWMYWVEAGEDRFAKSALLMRVASIAADEHVSSVPRSRLEPAEQGVLGKVVGGDLLRVQNNRIRFSHDLLSDWARLHALIDDEWLSTPQSRQRYASPRWFRAIRLYGQRLLEQSPDGVDGWRKSLEIVSDGTPVGTLIRDLLLEALFVAPNSHALLEQTWPVLVTNDGKLLNKLIDRFLYVATLPDPRLALLLDEAQDASQYEHLMRLPFWPYWIPFITVLHAHSAEIVEIAPTNAAKVCSLWLRTMDFGDRKGMWREPAADLALAIAREAQFFEGQPFYYLGGMDKVVFEALLWAASERPAEVSEICLEMANRRDLNPQLATRIGLAISNRNAEQANVGSSHPKRTVAPPPITPLGRMRKPWPDGPKRRISKNFEEACLNSGAFGALAKANPEAALEVLLAICIEEPKREEYGHSLREELGLTYWHGGEPPMWFKGPFHGFLAAAPEHALTFTIKLANFATQRSSRRQKFDFEIDGMRKSWFGDAEVFTWHYDSYMSQGSIIQCALMALEKWFYEQIQGNIDVAPAVARIVREGESMALAGLLFTVAKLQPSLVIGPLAPLAQSWILWSWDHQLTHQRAVNIRGGLGGYWGNQAEAAIKLAAAWVKLPHRTETVCSLMVKKFLPHTAYDSFFQGLIYAWEKELDKDRLPTDLRDLVEAVRKENYTFEVVDGELTPIEFRRSEADQIELNAKSEKAGQILQLLQFPSQCRQLLDKAGIQLQSPEILYAYLKKLQESPMSYADEDGEVVRVENAVFGGIAVLIKLHYEWLIAEPSRLAWSREILAECLNDPPRFSKYVTEVSVGTDNWDAFAVEAGLNLFTKDPTDALARSLVSRGMVSFLYGTTHLLVMKAAELRSSLGDDFGRIVSAAVWWSQIRSIRGRLPPEFGAEIAYWDAQKSKLIAAFNDRTLSPTVPDIKTLNDETRDVLDDIHAKQYPEHAQYREARPQWKGTRQSREEIHPEDLALDIRVLTAAFTWLWVTSTTSRPECLEVKAKLFELLSVTIATVPRIEDHTTQEIKGLPSSFDIWVFGRIAQAIPMLAVAETTENLWQPILDLGPPAHHWVEYFYWEWFTKAPAAKNDLKDFFCHWRMMIAYTIANPKWNMKARRYFRIDDAIYQLLGFDQRWTVWRKMDGIVESIDAMEDLYRSAAALWFDMPKVLGGFVGFMASLPASRLEVQSIPWVSAAIEKYSDYDWRYGAEDAVLDYLDTNWKRHGAAITENSELRGAFFKAVTTLAARGSHAAIALRDRVANSTPR